MSINRRAALKFIAALPVFASMPAFAEFSGNTDLDIIDLPEDRKAWARNTINAVIFRKDSVASNRGVQYIAFYDEKGEVILGNRRLGTDEWTFRKTGFTGNIHDAHNTISIIVDGAGILHMAWDHHGQSLNYVKSVEPGSLMLTDRLIMTGIDEMNVTYPEFFNLPDGGLLFMFRDGSSGNGRTMLNRYDAVSGIWEAIARPLIDGEGLRNAYTNQIAIDNDGSWHISWCWRETGDVSSNHDICYAVSHDEGMTWQTSRGARYRLPIIAETAEYAFSIPQKSELINHTSMTTDNFNHPLIATYWRPEDEVVPQYQVVWHDGLSWRASQIGERKSPFTLSGAGTKRIPMSRPKVLVDREGRTIVIFRDQERGWRVSAAVSEDPHLEEWDIFDLSEDDVGLWEPSYDTSLWQQTGMLNLYVQKVGQGDGERLEDLPPQIVSIYEWQP